MPQTIVVVPCYNEASRLNIEVFKSFAHDHRDIHFLLVNDGSQDRTEEIIRRLQADDPACFTAYSLPRNSGKAEAVRHGILRAFESSPDYVAFWDADLATPLEAILDFRLILADRPQIEVVIGSRVKLLGRAIERRPIRHYLGRIAATLASITLRLHVYDTQCGAKMFRATPDMAAIFSTKFQTRWIFDIELLARLIQQRHGSGLPSIEQIVYEMPLVQWRDVRGSNVKAGDFLSSALELVTVRRTYLSRRALGKKG